MRGKFWNFEKSFIIGQGKIRLKKGKRRIKETHKARIQVLNLSYLKIWNKIRLLKEEEKKGKIYKYTFFAVVNQIKIEW